MKKFANWLRNMASSDEGAALALAPSLKEIRGQFLALPGEIRNQIYLALSSLTIANCSKHEHLAASALHRPLFRASGQIRTEALAYLCATHKLQILGIGTANLFFECAGEAIKQVKQIVIVQAASEIVGTRASEERVERLFGYLGETGALKGVKVVEEGVEMMYDSGEGGEHAGFLRRVEGLRERGVDVVVGFGGRKITNYISNRFSGPLLPQRIISMRDMSSLGWRKQYFDTGIKRHGRETRRVSHAPEGIYPKSNQASDGLPLSSL
ncbi:hypothetical protein EJ02DRAFT_460600 [Clathrospora elynae]|uniref:Uncharacterized protein n=1 Tax=Clathrospora elynae TaxID=706981 RepID=A0A6A5SCL2_9PLEO|nr:hypothetical protein EJ02DRAFT_460600 [Clathrospora elynae]